MATSNPVEYEGTYPLPEAQLDRFMVRLAIGYPTPTAEVDVLTRRLARRPEEAPVAPGRRRPDAARHAGRGRGGPRSTRTSSRYCVDLAAATRSHEAVEVGASPRGSQALMLVARALAVLSGRRFVAPEDVKAVAVPALAHRITLTPATWAAGVVAEDVVREVLGRVPGPATVPVSG